MISDDNTVADYLCTMAQQTLKTLQEAVDVLAFGAHPDDVELSAGGTLAKLASQGKRCAIVDLTRGELGTRGSAKIRKREAAASASILGLVHRENLGLADGFFEVNEDSLRLVVSAIRRLRPSVVLANAIEDRHPDHGRGASSWPARPSSPAFPSCDRFRRRPRGCVASSCRVPLHPGLRPHAGRRRGHHGAPRHEVRGHLGLWLTVS